MDVEASELLTDKITFCQTIERLLLSINQLNNNQSVIKRLDCLKKSIESCIMHSGRVYVFGSRMYGIANDDSDVDLYFDAGDCFTGKIADNYSQQKQLIELFVGSTNKELTKLEIIEETPVPIIRFLHDSTNFKCDLHFRSGLSVLSSELVKVYLSMDERVRWVIVAVKHWAIAFNLLNNNFSSFSLIWLVLFVMMKNKIVPPIIDLWKMNRNHEPNFIEGWDTRICYSSDQVVSIISSKSTHTKWELLHYFFKFYSNLNILEKNVLCTTFGELIPKKSFYSTFISEANAIENYHFQIEKFKKCKTLINNNFGSFNRIELQNPLKLCNNVTAWLKDSNMKLFIDLCTKSANSMRNT